MRGRGSAARGSTTTRRHINERWQCNKRQHEAEVVQQEVTQQPARESQKQKGGSRWRLHVERQREGKCDTIATATTVTTTAQQGVEASATMALA
jgi:hypothetical protein